MTLLLKIQSGTSLLTTLFLLLSASILPTALSQEDDDKICACTPREYKWKLDFSQTCDYAYIGNRDGIIGIDVGPDFGVKDANCAVLIENQITDDENTLVPVKVTGYQIIEFGRNLQRIKAINEPEGFAGLFDGDEVSFTSSFNSIQQEIPSAIIAYLFAENANGEKIELQWFVRFSNLCDTIPFKDGDHLGWTVFVSHQ